MKPDDTTKAAWWTSPHSNEIETLAAMRSSDAEDDEEFNAEGASSPDVPPCVEAEEQDDAATGSADVETATADGGADEHAGKGPPAATPPMALTRAPTTVTTTRAPTTVTTTQHDWTKTKPKVTTAGATTGMMPLTIVSLAVHQRNQLSVEIGRGHLAMTMTISAMAMTRNAVA